jgi:hypothetical protein
LHEGELARAARELHQHVRGFLVLPPPHVGEHFDLCRQPLVALPLLLYPGGGGGGLQGIFHE